MLTETALITMVIGSDELEQIADSLEGERLIHVSLFCGRCGYNLRTLPHVYTCPECGNPYNARPLKMEGIFQPHSAYIPVGDILAFLLSSLVAAPLLVTGVSQRNSASALFGMFFAALAVSLAVQAYRRLAAFLKFRGVYKRIAREVEEED